MEAIVSDIILRDVSNILYVNGSDKTLETPLNTM